MKEPAVALNVALLALAAIDTVAGTVIGPVGFNAMDVADATGALIVTVQAATAPGARDVGEHVRPLRVELVTVETVTVPPVPLIAIALPSEVEPTPLETPMDADVAPAASVTVTVATAPLEMRLALMPLPIHMYPVEEPAQVNDLPVAVNAGPGVTANELTEAAG